MYSLTTSVEDLGLEVLAATSSSSCPDTSSTKCGRRWKSYIDVTVELRLHGGGKAWSRRHAAECQRRHEHKLFFTGAWLTRFTKHATAAPRDFLGAQSRATPLGARPNDISSTSASALSGTSTAARRKYEDKACRHACTRVLIGAVPTACTHRLSVDPTGNIQDLIQRDAVWHVGMTCRIFSTTSYICLARTVLLDYSLGGWEAGS